MRAITTIGLDIAKSVFQVHGVDASGQVIIRRRLKRRYVPAFFQKLEPCLIGIEACATSHLWSRELQALTANRRPRLASYHETRAERPRRTPYCRKPARRPQMGTLLPKSMAIAQWQPLLGGRFPLGPRTVSLRI